jgi:hypothetical protein
MAMDYFNDYSPVKPKIKIQEQIPCKKGKHFSGWTNNEVALVPIDKDRDLKCQTCGEIVISIKAKVVSEKEITNTTPKKYKGFVMDL